MYLNRILYPSIARFTPLVSFGIFTRQNQENDVNLIGQPSPSAPQTGWDRVIKMYTRDQNEEVSLEMTNVVQSTMSGTFVGACIGGFVYSKSAYLNFVENNQASIFKSTADAKKKLQDYVTVSFAKGAVRWGWRLGIFTGIFSLTSTTIAVYRGNTSVVEYITAGAMAGALYKLHLGLAATIVGSGLGAVLGAFFGSIIVGILKLTGLTMDDIRKALNKINEKREDQFKQALDKESMIKNDVLTQHHEHLVKEMGPRTLADLE